MTPYANGKRRVARGSVHTEGHELVAPELAKWPLCLLLIIAWKDVPRCRLSRGWTDLTIFLRTRPDIRRSRKGLVVAWRGGLDSAAQQGKSGRFRISGSVRKTPR